MAGSGLRGLPANPFSGKKLGLGSNGKFDFVDLRSGEEGGDSALAILRFRMQRRMRKKALVKIIMTPTGEC